MKMKRNSNNIQPLRGGVCGCLFLLISLTTTSLLYEFTGTSSAGQQQQSSFLQLLPVAHGRIIGGTKMRVNERPYFVMPDPSSSYICGGVLLWEDIVLTTAHCKIHFQDTNKVCVGGNDRDCKTSKGIYNISTMIQHPTYNSFDFQHDIMLMKLKEVVSGVPYAILNVNTNIPLVNETVIAIGYGQISDIFDAPLSEHLLKVGVEVYDYKLCKDFWYDTRVRSVVGSSKALCTTTINGGRDTCFGDAGGPIFIHKTDIVVGITSYRRSGCGRPSTPVVNVRVSGYINWIHHTICTLSANPPSYCSSTGSSSSDSD